MNCDSLMRLCVVGDFSRKCGFYGGELVTKRCNAPYGNRRMKLEFSS